jgi:cell division protein FtsL
MRALNLIVAAALVLAAAYVYKIKVAATVEAERVAKLRTEIAQERDAIAALRAETAKLENPTRIQRLADHYFPLKPFDPLQVDSIDAIPLRTTDFVEPEIETFASDKPKTAPAEVTTGSVRQPARAR